MGGKSGSGPDVEKPEQTEEERELAQRGAEHWNKYVRKYVPQALNTVDRSRVTGADRRDVAAQSAAAAAHQTPRASTIIERAAGGAQGGAAIAGLQDAAAQQATMTGMGEARGRFEEDQKEHAGLMRAVATGHGVDSLADSAYRSMAQGATQESIGDAQIDFANEMRRQRRNQQLARTAAGAAIGAGVGGPSGALMGSQTANAMSSNYAANDWATPATGPSGKTYSADEVQDLHSATATASGAWQQHEMQRAAYGNNDPMRNAALQGANMGAGWGYSM